MNLLDWFSPRRAALRDKLRRDPYYRLATSEIPLAVELGVKIEVNQASVDDWLRLPGLSIHQARSLVELSARGIHFYSLEDVAAALDILPQRLQPLAPLLSFSYYDSTVSTPERLDLNRASVAELAQIPGIDRDLAEKIVQQRQNYGAYRSLADLHQRLDLATELTASLIHYLRASEKSPG